MKRKTTLFTYNHRCYSLKILILILASSIPSYAEEAARKFAESISKESSDIFVVDITSGNSEILGLIKSLQDPSISKKDKVSKVKQFKFFIQNSGEEKRSFTEKQIIEFLRLITISLSVPHKDEKDAQDELAKVSPIHSISGLGLGFGMCRFDSGGIKCVINIKRNFNNTKSQSELPTIVIETPSKKVVNIPLGKTLAGGLYTKEKSNELSGTSICLGGQKCNDIKTRPSLPTCLAKTSIDQIVNTVDGLIKE